MAKTYKLNILGTIIDIPEYIISKYSDEQLKTVLEAYLTENPITEPLTEEETVSLVNTAVQSAITLTEIDDETEIEPLVTKTDVLSLIEENSGSVSDEQIGSAVSDYLTENPIESTVTGGTNVLVVGNGTSFKYNTIASAITDANDGDTILIYPYEYVISSPIGSTKELNFIGIDRDKCIIRNSKADKVTGDVFFMQNSGVIKNLTLISDHSEPINTEGNTSYAGYCIHCDSTSLQGKTIKIEDCNMLNKYCAPIGIGGQQDCSIIIKNCNMYKYDLNPREAMQTNGVVYAHISSTADTTGQFISVQNCYLKSKYKNVVRIDWTNTNNREMKCEFINNVCVSEELGVTDIASCAEGGRTITSYGNNVTELNGGTALISGEIDTNVTLSSISVVKTKTAYTINDNLNVDDITVTAKYSNNSSKTVTLYTTNADSIDMTTTGSKTLTISYSENDIEKTYNITLTVNENSGSGGNEETVTDTIIASAVIDTTGNLQSNTSGKSVYVFKVEPESTVYLTTSVMNNLYIAYEDIYTDVKGTALQNFVSLGYTQATNKEIVVPSGMNYLYVSVYSATATVTLTK